MSTLHKVKAYFGMAPMDDYDDEYYDDEDRSSRGYSRRPREDRFEDEGYARPEGRGYSDGLHPPQMELQPRVSGAQKRGGKDEIPAIFGGFVTIGSYAAAHKIGGRQA